MDGYIKPCETYPDEDFPFDCTVTEVDQESGDICFDVTTNPRCDECFFREDCLRQVMEALASDFGVEQNEVIDESPRVNH